MSNDDFTKRPDPGEEDLVLYPLVPKFLPEKHKVYVKLLKGALSDPAVKNIALAGPYGCGKSSILKGFQEEMSISKRSVSISLATFEAPIEESSRTEDIHFLLEKEIVKQLLFSQSPQHLPYSRIDRSGQKHTLTVWIFAALAGALSVPIVRRFIGGFSHSAAYRELSALIQNFSQFIFWVEVIFAVLTAFLLGSVLIAITNKLTLQQFKAGPAELIFDSRRNTSYFDYYSDEILYFFQATKKDIVIFEDLDRFNDRRIFDALRTLNILINNQEAEPKPLSHEYSHTLKEPVRFIYATREDLFENPSQTPQESMNINRAKFFDVIIPVIPFISHWFSRDIIRDRLEKIASDSNENFDELYRRTLHHFSDPRVIHNVCNEFLVQNKILIEDERNPFGLSRASLLALQFYKEYNPTDYYAMLSGHSKLDSLRTILEQAKEREITLLERELRKIDEKLNQYCLTKRHISILQDGLLHFASKRIPNPESLIEVSSRKFGSTRPDDTSFWWQIIKGSKNAKITFSMRYPNQVNDFNCTQEELFLACQDSGHFRNFNTFSDLKDELLNEISEKKSMQADYYAQISEIFGLEIKSAFTDTNRNGLSIFPLQDLPPFTPSEKELISSGYIPHNFMLYITKYESNTLSPAGLRFAHQQTLTGAPDLLLPLTESDIKRLIIELPQTTWLAQPSFNFRILAFILTHQDFEQELSDSIIRAHGQILEGHPTFRAYFYTELIEHFHKIPLNYVKALLLWSSKFSPNWLSEAFNLKSTSDFYASAVSTLISTGIDIPTLSESEFLKIDAAMPAALLRLKCPEPESQLDRFLEDNVIRVPDIRQVPAKYQIVFLRNAGLKHTKENLDFLANAYTLEQIKSEFPDLFQSLLEQNSSTESAFNSRSNASEGK